MNAAKKTILLLWLLVVASLGTASALTLGATENRTWEKSWATTQTCQAEPLQTLGGHQENGGVAYDVALDSLLAAETTVAEGPNFINSARVLMRAAEESGPYHNFPGSFDAQILQQGTRTVTPNFYNVAKPLLSNDAAMYELRGSINGVEGTFQIGTRPSVSGNTELIMHRFFSPDW